MTNDVTYILQANWGPYEGTQLIGVYTDFNLAIKARNEVGPYHEQYVEIITIETNTPVEEQWK